MGANSSLATLSTYLLRWWVWPQVMLCMAHSSEWSSIIITLHHTLTITTHHHTLTTTSTLQHIAYFI